jgi:hypothetical protein
MRFMMELEEWIVDLLVTIQFWNCYDIVFFSDCYTSSFSA